MRDVEYDPEGFTLFGGEPRTPETAMERSAALGRIVESTFDAVVILDDGGGFVWMNPAANRMLRISSVQRVGRSIDRFLPAATAAALGRASIQLTQGSIAHAFSDPGQSLVRADGEEFEFESSMCRIELRGRGYFCIVTRDLEERRRQREENLQLLQQSAYLQAELDAAQSTAAAGGAIDHSSD